MICFGGFNFRNRSPRRDRHHPHGVASERIPDYIVSQGEQLGNGAHLPPKRKSDEDNIHSQQGHQGL